MYNDVHLTYNDVHIDVNWHHPCAKIYQALPPLFLDGSKVMRGIYIAEDREPGNEAI